jgi:hypothetical protein
MEEPSQTPEQTLKYSFEEIVTVEPKHFVDGGNAFKVRSSEANYYGEITVGQRSYIEGASGNLEGTYALFVTENGGSAFVDIEFADDGFSYKNQFLGVKEGDAVKYPFDTNDIYNSLLECHYNRKQSLVINKLSYLRIDWRSSKSVFPEREFHMLAVVISKDDAIRYAQDGTLPPVLEGLTVTGLDQIFATPDNKPQASKGSAEVIEIAPSKYADVGIFSEGLAAVNASAGSDGRWGYIDEEGNEVIPLIHLSAEPFSDGLALVQTKDRQWGFIDKTGNEIIPFRQYDGARSFSEGLATVYTVNNHGRTCAVIDTTGNVVVSGGKYYDIEPFSEGLAVVVGFDRKLGVIDKTGNEVIPPVLAYHKIEPFSEGMAAVQDKDGKWGFIDSTGNEVSRPRYDNALSFSEGLAAVYCHKEDSYDGYWGFVDRSGNEVIPLSFPGYIYSGESFSDGTAAVGAALENGSVKKIVIDRNGNQISSLEQYTGVGSFIDGMAVCTEGVIDKQGVLLVASDKDKFNFTDKNYTGSFIPIQSNNRYGFIRVVNK